MGEELKPPDEHNENGYFEDRQATRMHEDWLQQRGLTLASISDAFPLEVPPPRRSKRSASTSPCARPWGSAGE